MEVLLELNLVVRCTCGLGTSMSDFDKWYSMTLSLHISQTCSRYQIGTPTRDKAQSQTEDTDIFHDYATNTVDPQHPTCLSQPREAWAMLAGCPGIHRIKPNISSGPSSAYEDPPQINSRLTLRVYVPARRTPQVLIPGLS